MGKLGKERNNNADVLAEKLAELFILQLDFQMVEKDKKGKNDSKSDK